MTTTAERFVSPRFAGSSTAKAWSRLLATLVVLVVMTTASAQPVGAQAAGQNQTAPATPAMQAGLDAAKSQHWDDAAKAFEQAREKEPYDPAVLFNGGLAESKIPGHEVRAAARLQAYLILSPQAPNAAAVKQSILALDAQVRAQARTLLAFEEKLLPDMPRDSLTRAIALPYLVQDYVYVGDLDKARPYIDESVGYHCGPNPNNHRYPGDYDWDFFLDDYLGLNGFDGVLTRGTFKTESILLNRGAFDDAARIFASQERVRCQDDFLIYPYLYRSRVEYGRGDLVAARRDMDEAGRHARNAGDPFHLFMVGMNRLRDGNMEGAQGDLDVMADLHDPQNADSPCPALPKPCGSIVSHAKVRARAIKMLSDGLAHARKGDFDCGYYAYYCLSVDDDIKALQCRPRKVVDYLYLSVDPKNISDVLTSLQAATGSGIDNALVEAHENLDGNLAPLEKLALIRKACGI
ncbi:MAG: hypothetical protein JSR34_01935 [Proteobacteria bacterium]|nr:hypothetical protein [Pseudomonadota bacterium]